MEKELHISAEKPVYDLPYDFIGDETFSIRADFIKPYSNRKLILERRDFNYCLSKIRITA